MAKKSQPVYEFFRIYRNRQGDPPDALVLRRFCMSGQTEYLFLGSMILSTIDECRRCIGKKMTRMNPNGDERRDGVVEIWM